MIVYPSMIVGAAEKAGMKVPSNPDMFSPEDFPHFAVFCNAQLCRRVNYHGEHWDNANVIAKIPDDQIMKVTLEDLIKRGLSFAT